MAKKESQATPQYESNPFLLSINALGRFFNHNAGWAIALIILGVLGFVLQVGGNIVQEIANPQSESRVATQSGSSVEAGTVIAIIVVIVTGVLIFMVVATAISAFIAGMFSYVGLKSEENKSVSFGEAFSAASVRFGRLFFAQLLAMLKIIGWSLLLIVPGIIAALRYKLLPYVIMDEVEGKDTLEAHARVKTLTKGRLWEVFGLGTVAGLIPFVGPIVDISGHAAMYRQMQVYTDKNLKKPSIHWLNYLGLIIFGFLAVIGLLIGTIVAVIYFVNRGN